MSESWESFQLMREGAGKLSLDGATNIVCECPFRREFPLMGFEVGKILAFELKRSCWFQLQVLKIPLIPLK